MFWGTCFSKLLFWFKVLRSWDDCLIYIIVFYVFLGKSKYGACDICCCLSDRMESSFQKLLCRIGFCTMVAGLLFPPEGNKNI